MGLWEDLREVRITRRNAEVILRDWCPGAPKEQMARGIDLMSTHLLKWGPRWPERPVDSEEKAFNRELVEIFKPTIVEVERSRAAEYLRLVKPGATPEQIRRGANVLASFNLEWNGRWPDEKSRRPCRSKLDRIFGPRVSDVGDVGLG